MGDDIREDFVGHTQQGQDENRERVGRAKQWVGRRLDGGWQLEKLRGIGGMSAVYQGRGPGGRKVAVKVMDPDRARRPEARQLFVSEAELMGRVAHPGAVDVLEMYDDAVVPFFVMELLEGWELSRLLRRRDSPFPPTSALKVGVQVLDVLEAYHRAGVVHLDVKPGNLFMLKTGRVTLLDFGAALDVEARRAGKTGPRAEPSAGTPLYMAPEQATGESERVGPLADLYATGATLFEMIAGRRIRQADSQKQAITAAARGAVPSLDEHSGVDEQVVRIVDRALEPALDERWPDAASMREALADAVWAEGSRMPTGLGTLDVEATPTSPCPSPTRWVDDEQLEQLGSRLDGGSEGWSERAALMAGGLWARSGVDERDGASADIIGCIADQLVDDRDWAALVRWLEFGARTCEHGTDRDRLAGLIVGGDRLAALIEGLDPESDFDEPWDVERLESAFVCLPPDRVPAVVRSFGRAHPAVRRGLAGYLSKALRGHEADTVQVIEQTHGRPAVELVDVLASTGTEAALRAVGVALEHPEDRVRQAAAERTREWMTARADCTFDAQIRQMLAADRLAVRRKALKLIRYTGTDRLGGVLARRAKSEDFDELPASERRQILQTLAEIDPDRAEQVAIELVQRHGFFARDARKTTRIIAIEVLADIGQRPEALEVVQEAGRLRFWNPQDVRSRAQASVEKIRRRR